MSDERCLIWFVSAFDPTARTENEARVNYLFQTDPTPLMGRTEAIEAIKRNYEEFGMDPRRYYWNAISYYGSDTEETLMARARCEFRTIPGPEEKKAGFVKTVCSLVRDIITDHSIFLDRSRETQPGGQWIH